MDPRNGYALGLTLFIVGCLLLAAGVAGTSWALADTCSDVEEDNDRCATTDLEVIMAPIAVLGLLVTAAGIFLTVRFRGGNAGQA